jgi:hypothetical protein
MCPVEFKKEDIIKKLENVFYKYFAIIDWFCKNKSLIAISYQRYQQDTSEVMNKPFYPVQGAIVVMIVW